MKTLTIVFLFFIVVPTFAQYCIPSNPSCGSNYISNFQIQGTSLNNTSTCTTTGSYAYSSFPASGSTTADLIQGNSYTFSVTTTSSNIVSIWIDFDQSGTFDTDEWVQVCTTSTSGVASTVNFTISGSASLGTTGLRIRSRAYGNQNDATCACTSFGSGETEDYTINIISATPCSGTPTAGTTVSSANTVCNAENFTLSLSGAAIENGLTYQWQSSPDNSTWTNISGATAFSLTTTQSASTYYQCVVTCTNSGLFTSSSSLNVTMNSIMNCFCTPVTSTYACDNMWITNVSTSSGTLNFNNNSTCASSSYSDFSSSYTASNIQLATTNMSFTSGGYAMAFSVWIDYNDNGIFETTERVIANNNTTMALTITDNFTIPITAVPGTHKMRVRGEYYNNGAPTDPCSQLQYGETEDYSFIVISTTPCSGTPNAGTTVSSENPVCSGVNFTLSLSGATNANGINYQWRSSNDNTTYTSIAGATYSTYTTSQTSAKYYRCIVNCSNSSLSSISTPVNVTMNPVNNCYCTPATSINACGYMWITNVTTSGGTTNFNYSSNCDATSFSDFSSANNTSNLQLSTTTMSFTSSGYALAYSVWIDFNDNGIFESSEKVISNNNTGMSFSLTDNFTVPINAPAGTHRMRVRGEYYGYSAPTDPCNQLDGGETEDYSFTVIALQPCSGTPDPGNTIPTASTVCPGINFTLSLQHNVAATGISYQWQSSPDNSSWTDISGATNPTLTTSQTASTYYQCIVICSISGSSATSTPFNVQMKPVIDCYCTPTPSNYACGSGWITNVTTFNGTTNFNNSSACAANSFTDYGSANIASNTQLSSTSVSVTTSGLSMAISVWIDYNDNGTFETTERVIVNNNSSSSYTTTSSFIVPSTAAIGIHKMRVRGEYYSYGAPSDPCSQLSYGETEDYSFKVTCSVTPIITTTTPSSICGPGIATLGATASYGTINWYADPTGGTSLGTDTTFNTPIIAATTTFYVDASDNDCISGTRTSVKATVNPVPPTPSIFENGSMLASSTATSYQWLYNATIIPGATSQFYNASNLSGFYQVIVSNVYGCTVLSDPYSYVGIESNVLDNTIAIYPNPATDKITVINNGNLSTQTQINIFNVTGQQVLSETYNYQNPIEINVNLFSEGIYLLKIQTNVGMVIKKLIIQ